MLSFFKWNALISIICMHIIGTIIKQMLVTWVQDFPWSNSVKLLKLWFIVLVLLCVLWHFINSNCPVIRLYMTHLLSGIFLIISNDNAQNCPKSYPSACKISCMQLSLSHPGLLAHREFLSSSWLTGRQRPRVVCKYKTEWVETTDREMNFCCICE